MFALVGLFVFALVGLNIWAIVDVARQPDHAWKAIKQDRTLWLVLTLLAGLPCSIAYLVAVRPRLEAVPTMMALPGWYPDPMVPGVMRYHDGTEWTAHAMRMLPPAQPYPPQAPYPPQPYPPQAPYPPQPYGAPQAPPPQVPYPHAHPPYPPPPSGWRPPGAG